MQAGRWTGLRALRSPALAGERHDRARVRGWLASRRARPYLGA